MAKAQNTLPPIGNWREHLPYNSTIDVTASSQKIYAATPYSLFSVSREDGEISRLSKVSGLSETGISTIHFDQTGDKLFIAYTNSNIDVIDTKRINNIPDLKRENIAGDKSIYHIYTDGDRAYLSTGFGVLILNTVKYETADTWLIGNGGQPVKTNMFAKDVAFFYAATEQGLKRTPVTTSNPADFSAWGNLSGSNGLSATACKGVFSMAGKLFAWQRDSVFVQTGATWSLFFANGFPIVSVNATDTKLVIAQSNVLGGISRVLLLNVDGTTFKTIQQAAPISYPQKAIITGGETWVADRFGGLSKWTGNSYESFVPNSPGGIATGEIIAYNDIVYAAAGSVNESWIYQYNRNGIFRLGDGQWTGYNSFNTPQLDSVLDFITVAVDPRDETVWGGSYGGGLVHIKGANSFQIYKQTSPISATIGDPTSYRVSGLAFDLANNLWVVNYGADKFLHVLKNDGSWQSFTAPFLLNQNAAAQVLIDDADQKWIVGPKGNGLIVFSHGASIQNLGDDQWKRYSAGAGNGNLPAGDVLSIAKDKSGFIWVGTSDGIGVIQCPEAVFSTTCEAILPIVSGGNFANYLFKGEEVRSIAVDGADRKWVATQNGVWLVSPDGDILIAHYTEENSPLLSNDVKHIGINGATGEVFFGTDKGISAFRGTATEGSETMSDVVVFPNPVPPNHNGLIGIKGLKTGSFVKITELNGRLVYQTRSAGGQATWNGKDYKGQSVASGVYLILVTNEGQAERAAGKVVFISK
ncbi:MAG: hypothetical protein JWP69_1227 [Flaviaesturariibacter sp.]|nr:hypothetical protein [Flaviaesturariibacter sp.]